MENLYIQAKHYNPKIYFNTDNNVFEISGDSFDKDFYKPVLKWLKQYLRQNRRPMTFNFRFNQINSGAFKGLNEVLELLQKYHLTTKTPVNVHWVSSPENDDTLDYGDDVKECFDRLPIQVDVA